MKALNCVGTFANLEPFDASNGKVAWTMRGWAVMMFRAMRKFLMGAGLFLFLLLAGGFLYVDEPDISRASLEAKYAGVPSRFVTLPDGTRVHVRDRGRPDALALVLIHGSHCSV